jgi:hypothetical protein
VAWLVAIAFFHTVGLVVFAGWLACAVRRDRRRRPCNPVEVTVEVTKEDEAELDVVVDLDAVDFVQAWLDTQCEQRYR